MIVYLGRHSLRGRGSWLREGIHRIRTGGANRNIDREYHLCITFEISFDRGEGLITECRRTADFDWCFEFEEDGLVDEDFSCLCAKELDLVFCQLHLLSRSVTSDCRRSIGRASEGGERNG